MRRTITETVNEIGSTLDKLGEELITITRISDNPDDDYLFRIITKKKNPIFPGRCFCTHLVNVSSPEIGLYEGHYDITFAEAVEIVKPETEE